MKSSPRVTSAQPTAAPFLPVSGEAAAEAMWTYYRDHKPLLVSDVREHRARILAQLLAGTAVEDAFSPYFKPAAPAGTLRRAA